MRTEGSAKRVTIATLIPRGAAVMDVSPADLARERTWRVQAEARVMAAEERARAAEERARAAEERARAAEERRSGHPEHDQDPPLRLSRRLHRRPGRPALWVRPGLELAFKRADAARYAV